MDETVPNPSGVPETPVPVTVPKNEADAKQRERDLHKAARKYCKTRQVPEDYARQVLQNNPQLLAEWLKK